MLEEKLKELDIKKTELANYLNISRPTMYKFIDLYDSGNRNEINKKVLKLFDYITDNDMIGKNNVIGYILNNLADVKELETKDETDLYKNIRKYVLENPNSEKSQFLELVCKKTSYDLVIHYLIEITPLLRKKSLTKKEKDLLIPYREIIEKYTIDHEEDK
jgi:predicted transcriptional regulator